ncbi:uncharacterized protein K489DRAFT_422752 [Dissoconium aciculare CBS 342.82]|uniref:Uncharacterized protein n=1 Tax=Dissoconium aciculare CBS 342.82 TaxID=1314786 RepID=A0A6J3M9F8_9PEZI|nr:uncharacterized protein K489DRAFT_422752 [Dissoconium aciculare CBS 342.82]KAF1824254.1 hypothetical protein K489DRAFT_422752 [Dissoconium aciculare CBS 342.82]
MAHNSSPVLQRASSASSASSFSNGVTPFLPAENMIDPTCIHGILHHECQYCDWRLAPGLIENFGAHTFDPTASTRVDFRATSSNATTVEEAVSNNNGDETDDGETLFQIEFDRIAPGELTLTQEAVGDSPLGGTGSTQSGTGKVIIHQEKEEKTKK